ncbi:MAG: M1 family metallopeptidase [Candidatus Nanosyncoccaceae bacterium]
MERLTKLFQPEHYQLTFDINQKKRTYRGIVRLEGCKTSPEITHIKLDAVDLQIEQVLVNQTEVEFSYNQEQITIPTTEDSKQQIEIKFSNNITEQMYGIYPCSYIFEGDKEEIIATQFESHYARYAFPCIDEPAAKATFTLTLVVDADHTVLSNTPVVKQITKRNRQLVRFETTPKMSSYTLGFVIGKLIKISGLTKSGIEVNAYASRAHQPEELEYGLRVAIDSLDWYEQYFGVSYPLPKCDHVALPDFAAGAMENWGLVTYREALFLVQPDTPIDLRTSIATVITHELAHMWFGNLVTMWWWDELWLNESLASILEIKCLDAIRPQLQVGDNYYAGTLFSALRRDSLPGVQPIITPINQPEEISTIFDGAIVYSKGACLMYMIESWVGKEIFQTGLQYYLKKHSYACASTKDFLKIFQRLSQQPVNQIIQKWLNQPGFPLIETNRNWQIRQRQFGYKTEQTWQIPLNLADKKLVLEESVKIAPQVINADGATYAVVKYDDTILNEILPQIINGDQISQYYFLTSQLLLAERSYQPYASLVPHINSFSHSSNQLTWLALARIVNNLRVVVADNKLGQSDLNQLAGSLAAAKLNQTGLLPQPEESINSYRLRSTLVDLVVDARETETLNDLSSRFNPNFDQIDADLRPNIIAAKLLSSSDNNELINQLFSSYQTTTNPDLKDDIMTGLAYAPKQSELEIIVQQFNNREIIKPQDIIMWYACLVRQRTGRSLAWRWLQDNFANLIDLFQASGDHGDFIRITAATFSTPEQLAEFKNFFTPYQEDPVLQREIKVGIKQITSKVNLINKQQKLVAQALRSALSSHNSSSTANSLADEP